MANISSLQKELEKEREKLEAYEAAQTRIIAGGQSYSLQNGDDKRSLENVSLATLVTLIDKTRSRISMLERRIEMGGRTGKFSIVGGRF